ncbi:Phosphoinositide phosphatase [Phytophthora palmivora]|uniref:Phosphoinositide phosphatase n=1 Tax=Phytophthora palmivora TaxID=4796 RepID=A0A2P4X3Y0_9STRA|nr:Phosphoinositide phosphatase [Phytophthora palmivora]
MPSLLGLHLGRYDPATSKPSRGWCNEVPFDDSDDDDEWEEFIRRHGSIESNQFDDNESVASLKIEEASEEAIEDEIEKSRNEVLRDSFDSDIPRFLVSAPSEMCPGPPPSPHPVPRKTLLRIFVATWNMAAKDPFAHRKRGQYFGDDLAAETLRELLPLGYDIYAIGTQEKVTKHLHAAVLARLHQHSTNPENSGQTYQRLVLTAKRTWMQNRSKKRECQHLRTYESSDFDSSVGRTSFCGSELTCNMCHPNATSTYNMTSPRARFSCNDIPTLQNTDSGLRCSWWSNQDEEKEIRGHGDHALIRRKSTGLSVYYANHLHGRIEVIAAGLHKFTGSKGGIATTIRIAGDPQTLTFVNCHLEANRIERRRRQLVKLFHELPRSLGLTKGDTTLANCSDHVIWMGDFNYRIRSLDGSEVLHLLSAGRLQELHDHYDSMADDLQDVPGLKAFREPSKWPTFYPTYKKVACRSRLPLSGSTTGTGRDTQWAQHVYKTTYREPFYKGGRIRERVPGWCDRILYCSRMEGPWENCFKVEQAACSDASRGISSFSPEAVRDNYRALNDELRDSDHSPVSCTFQWSVHR